MILWLLIALLAMATAYGLVRPILFAPEAAPDAVSAVSILKGQLAALAAQVEAGELSAAEAAPLKLEIERRILAEAREAGAGPAPGARALGGGARARAAFVVGTVAAAASVGLYTLLGAPEAGSAPRPAATLLESEGDVLRLEAEAQARPGVPENWRRLGLALFQAQRYAEAAEAYARAARLAPDQAVYPSAMGEALVGAADGAVTDAAAAAFSRALALDPTDPRARYFLALRKDQDGDAEGAMADWIDLLNGAPDGAPWAVEMRRFIEQTARERGVDLSGRLRPAGAPRGPDAAQIEAAQALTPEAQAEMIAGMIGGLEARLAQSPRDPEGWARLMQARMVLGEPERAVQAWRAGRAALEGDPQAQAQLDAAARQLGVPGA